MLFDNWKEGLIVMLKREVFIVAKYKSNRHTVPRLALNMLPL